MIVEAIYPYINNQAFLYQLSTTIFVYYVIRVIRFYVIRSRRYRLFSYYGIPGPKPSIWNGNTAYYYKDHKRFEVDLGMSEKYGPTWGYFTGDLPLLTSTDLTLIKRVFVEDNENVFIERIPKTWDIIVHYGILFARRPRWKFFRKVLSAPFARFTSRGQASVQFVEDSVQLMIRYIDNKLDLKQAELADEKEQLSSQIDMYDLLKANALYIISALALKLPIEVKEKEPHVTGLNDYMNNWYIGFRLSTLMPGLTGFFAWLVNLLQSNNVMVQIYNDLKKKDELLAKRLDEEQQSSRDGQNDHLSTEDDILNLLIKLKHRKLITQKEYLGNVEGLIIAGYETTSTTLIYTLWAIAKHVDIQHKLRDQLQLHGHESKYLEQVVYESMRLYPAVPCFVSRVATKTVEINGLVIPEGTEVMYNAYVMNLNTIFWNEPERFDPDRFEGADGTEIGQSIYFSPFGFGERRCLGYKLAMLEMKIVLSELILRYRLTLKSPQNLEMISSGSALTKPKNEICIDLVRTSPKSD